MTARYQGERDTIERAVNQLLDELREEELIVADDANGKLPSNDNVAGTTKPEASPRAEFRTPIFEKFTDMQELILLDPIHQVDEAGWPSAISSGQSAYPEK